MYCLRNKHIMVKNPILGCLLLLLFLPFYAFSNSILFNQLDTEALLPHPSVTAVVQDHNGFIWFGTQNGLSRYDGKKIVHYYNQPDDPYSINNNWISALYSDREGRLWVGTASGAHLYLPETDSFKNFEQDEIKDASIGTITEDNQGHIWFSSHFSGVIKYDIQSGQFTTFNNQNSKLKASELNDILIDDNNNVWVATVNNGIVIKLADSDQFVGLNLPLPTDKIKALYQAKDKAIWLGTDDSGVFRYANDEITDHFISPDSRCSNSITDILQDQMGEFWFGTEQGLCQLTADKQLIQHQQKNEEITGLTDNRIFSLMQDSGGVIWVGTISGVSKWNASLTYFDHINKMNNPDLSSNSVMAFTTVENNLFVGSWGEGVSRLLLPEASTEVTDYDRRLATIPQQNIMSLFADSQQNLWLGTYRNGLYVLPKRSNDVIHLTHDSSYLNTELSSDSISKFIELEDGSVLVGTYGGGINNLILNDNTLLNTEAHQRFQALPTQFVLDMTMDGEDLWIASSDEGLIRFNSAEQTVFNVFEESKRFAQFKIEEVFGVVIDGDTIWTATNSGLLSIAKPDNDNDIAYFNLFNNQQGLASNFVYGLLQDTQGHIWLSHAKGVSRFTPDSQKIQNFNTTHGLQSVDFNSSALHQTQAGRLLFGGNHGFNSFLPDQIPINTAKPALRLTGFKLKNTVTPIQQALSTDGHIELKHNETVVDFEFAALDYTRSENNMYRYKMDGMSQVWHELGKNNLVSFSHLPAGNYELNVQGSNNDGIWSDIMRLPIRVLPPFWQTSTAYLAYIITFVVLFTFIFRRQKQQHLKRKAHAKHLHRLAYYDSLTGLPNRQNFYESLGNYILEAEHKQQKFAVVLFNLDRLKRINDTLSHEFGDKVLVEASSRVYKFITEQLLTPPLTQQYKFNSNFARLGGDEFVLLINRAHHREQISQVVHQLIELISQPIEIDKYQVTITPSLGIASYPQDGHSVSDLLKHADIALHQAKAEGRRMHKFYGDVLDNKAMERLQIEEMMRDAISNNEFELYYQPQVNVKRNSVTKAEALIRWNSPVLGFVSPADFIPIAEESGLIIELGDWVLNRACEQAKVWQQQGLTQCKVSVNVSSVQFKQSALLDKIQQALIASGLPAHLLEIELTESAIMSDLEDNIARLNSLKNMGVSIACDDFGTGYSSLSYLKQFPLDSLKIDRSFIEDVATDENDAAIVKAIMLLADTMNLNVIAEGVETIEQLKVLNQFNCELIQGFYFSKPLPNDAFIQFVKEGFYQDKFMWELDLVGKD